MEKEINLGLYEIFDRSAILANQFEKNIFQHNECKSNKRIKKSAKKLMKDLYAFYQLVGEEYFKDE